MDRGEKEEKKGDKREKKRKKRTKPEGNLKEKEGLAQNRYGLNSSMQRAHQMPRLLKKKIAHTNSWCTDSPANSWKVLQEVHKRKL